ncbi:alcohol dehydrogenase-like 7 [Hibiscus syriacus]|uniref:Alcohol dehydrogenase-like 7 n=1 Tax=Hibiscus syriacus TaxID=106335 RepID=A0A6A2WXW3_HIBSY|nr:alcohol dehydrogenase-like 7 [Hibiscus syriacus]
MSASGYLRKVTLLQGQDRREYFCRLNSLMQTAILKSSPDHFPKYEQTFNGPQLAAIQWAATHTAAGISSGLTKRQEPWPFTLVQGPPGTTPESYKQANDSNPDNVAMGSIDEVLHNMDQNLFRFIDGEMKIYRPDVARVGVDSQTWAVLAVSAERRTEQLLQKNHDEIFGHIQTLKAREAMLSQQIATLQRELNAAAVTVRSQGSVGVDPDILVARDQNRDVLLQNLAAVVENRDKALVKISRLLILEPKFRVGSNFNLEEARANLEASFANEAVIVFTTVSSCGRKLFSRLTHGFDMVVIDEAAQASEVAVLPSLSLRAARCVLVGDPQQLPATIISKAAGTLLYSRSLFERFQQAGCPTMLLSVQYRMHPQIRDFPSRYFYQGRLIDSESVVSLPDGFTTRTLYLNLIYFMILPMVGNPIEKTSKSLGVPKITVGINTIQAAIEMHTTYSSNECCSYSCQKGSVELTLMFLQVMGNASALVQSDDWVTLIADAKARNCYMDMDSLPKDFTKDLLPKDFSEPSGLGYSPSQGKAANMRGLRSVGPSIGDKSRDAWQYGIQKNFAGTMGKRDS